MGECEHWGRTNSALEKRTFFCHNPLHALVKAITVRNISILLLIWQGYSFDFSHCLDRSLLCGTINTRDRNKLRRYGYKVPPDGILVHVQTVYGICIMSGKQFIFSLKQLTAETVLCGCFQMLYFIFQISWREEIF